MSRGKLHISSREINQSRDFDALNESTSKILNNNNNNSNNSNNLHNNNVIYKNSKNSKGKENDHNNNQNTSNIANANSISNINNNSNANNLTNFNLNEANNFFFNQTHKKRNIKKIAYKTQAGKNENGLTKINQDNYLIMENILNSEEFKIFGVFDGHGIAISN